MMHGVKHDVFNGAAVAQCICLPLEGDVVCSPVPLNECTCTARVHRFLAVGHNDRGLGLKDNDITLKCNGDVGFSLPHGKGINTTINPALALPVRLKQRRPVKTVMTDQWWDNPYSSIQQHYSANLPFKSLQNIMVVLSQTHISLSTCCSSSIIASVFMAFLPPNPWHFCLRIHNIFASVSITFLPPNPWHFCLQIHGVFASKSMAFLSPYPWHLETVAIHANRCGNTAPFSDCDLEPT